MKESGMYSLLLYSLFKPNYDNTEKRLRWELPRIFVDYRCKLVGDESLDPDFSKTDQLHKYREHKTQDISQLFLCVSILNICMLQLYILNHYSTYFVIVAKDAMVQSP